jgi:predicted RNA polymerase sigma factor
MTAANPSEEVLAHAAADAVARRSYGKLVALLAARTRDLTAAEDALSEAFTSALRDWPRSGVPENPEGWLLTVARRKSIDSMRRLHGETDGENIEQAADPFAHGTDGEALPDRRLGLMFACAHPAIDPGIRSPLMLQVILGLDAATIAAAFLISPATMGKRLVRAKEKIRQAGIPFTIPEREELAPRLDAVLEAIYAAFAEGWSDPGGTDAARRDLTEEAFFLAALVAELLPGEAEALGLLALMLHTEARRQARRSPAGAYIPLARQNPDLWNQPMIDHAENLLLKASTLGRVGRYQLEAAIQSAHVRRCRTGEANWDAILHLYDELLALTASPVVAINRALALAEVEGVESGLAAMPDAACDARLLQYQPYWAARAELLSRHANSEEARHAWEIAIGLERDPAVREFLQQRLKAEEKSR